MCVGTGDEAAMVYRIGSIGSMTGVGVGRDARAWVPAGAGRTGSTGVGALAMRKKDRLLTGSYSCV